MTVPYLTVSPHLGREPHFLHDVTASATAFIIPASESWQDRIELVNGRDVSFVELDRTILSTLVLHRKVRYSLYLRPARCVSTLICWMVTIGLSTELSSATSYYAVE